MTRFDLADSEWPAIQPLLPNKAGTQDDGGLEGRNRPAGPHRERVPAHIFF
jgi:hypothetical protein